MTVSPTPPRSRRLVALVASVGLLASAALSLVSPAPAAAAGCQGGAGGSVVFGDCQGQGGGTVPGYQNPVAGVKWVVVEDWDQSRPCVDRLGNPSWMVSMYGMRNGVRVQTLPYYCLTQHLVPGETPTTAQARLAIPQPTLTSDFAGNFLTGAEVKFTLSQPGVLRQDIAGFNARVEAHPTSYLWNFGDGTTSTEAEPIHIYRDKNINAEHLAKVQVTVVYEALLFAQNDDGPIATQDLGDVTVQSTLERPIVEVWSALTKRS